MLYASCLCVTRVSPHPCNAALHALGHLVCPAHEACCPPQDGENTSSTPHSPSWRKHVFHSPLAPLKEPRCASFTKTLPWQCAGMPVCYTLVPSAMHCCTACTQANLFAQHMNMLPVGVARHKGQPDTPRLTQVKRILPLQCSCFSLWQHLHIQGGLPPDNTISNAWRLSTATR